ncbi:MAG: alkaline phosphatase family protein, partial [Planctomycetota bacterium]|nr:alkaline phosphatase family protein [Planctomycetota bacterium]
LNTLFNQVGNTYPIPNFERLRDEGAGTLAAHIDNNTYETLPNHTSIITARPQAVGTIIGHNWTQNGEPITSTIHANKTVWLPGETHYVYSVFDVAHDNGLRTGMYANKTKFSLFDNTGYALGGGSYNATYGAIDTTGPDNNGRRKLDNTYINTSLGGTIADTYIANQKANPMQFAFLHFNNPDSAGHGSGWGSDNYYDSVVAVDVMLGKIFSLIEEVGSPMKDKTAIILTADHGYQGAPGANTYSVPFYVWGPGVDVGADLYALNALNRKVASSYPMITYGGIQPIRNAEASNLALEFLGLGPIPGSTFNYAQDLQVPEPATMGLLALGGLALLRRRRKAA